jgi:hypothetical protein
LIKSLKNSTFSLKEARQKSQLTSLQKGKQREKSKTFLEMAQNQSIYLILQMLLKVQIFSNQILSL